MAALPIAAPLPGASPSAAMGVTAVAVKGRRAPARVRTVPAALGDGCGGGGGMEQHHGDAPRSPVKVKPVMSNVGNSTNIYGIIALLDNPIGRSYWVKNDVSFGSQDLVVQLRNSKVSDT